MEQFRKENPGLEQYVHWSTFMLECADLSPLGCLESLPIIPTWLIRSR